MVRPSAPPERGTRRYAERLVCVRYRYDDARQERVTTVERVVDRAPWVPRADTTVGVRVAWGGVDIARRVKRAGEDVERAAKAVAAAGGGGAPPRTGGPDRPAAYAASHV
ncbi:hypothetical protein [Rubrivirga litoralis]|uniref:Uncharacterized protein n=1 Tax=Rubrivirga litoralis TaxID=3075598 RepID=A0ABU3BVH1_9BACT|nr:hypothetical protein [Rubrivirga sp. F394]MDT0633277.1 hypothetical protein [Rubrivirga sp. F394]